MKLGLALHLKTSSRFLWPARAFSIIEAMISMVILLVAVLSVITVIPATLGFAFESSVRIQAAGAAQDYLDTIRQYIKTSGVDTNLPAAPVIKITSGKGIFPSSSRPDLGNFTETPRCTARSLFSFDCTVTVAWNQYGAARSVQVESHIESQAGF